MSSSTSNDPWAWLGLLKWSLAYSDGTSDASDVQPMSDEDKAFLEAVMKDGIINEGDRMKEILTQLTEHLDALKKGETPALTEEQVDELLLELRDIVEQIDYARAFTAIKGLPFLLGCASERNVVPRSIRMACLGLLATLCQNNPPVQLELLNLGSLKSFTEDYFGEYPAEYSDTLEECNGQLRSKVIQAMSANVRSHAVAEDVFCHLEEGRRVLASALGMFAGQETLPPPPVNLEKRALFFLRALVTSDTSTRERVRWFNALIAYVADKFTQDDADPELREMTLSMLDSILEQKKSVNAVLDRKDALVARGVKRISEIRALQGEERDSASVELELWENLLVLLARAEPDVETAPQ